MLYQLGALPIQVAPFNAHEVSETGEAEYAVKPVVGREPPLEFVGEGGNESKRRSQAACRRAGWGG